MRKVVFAQLINDAKEPGVKGLSTLSRTLKDGLQKGITMWWGEEGLEFELDGHKCLIPAANVAYVRFEPETLKSAVLPKPKQVA